MPDDPQSPPPGRYRDTLGRPRRKRRRPSSFTVYGLGSAVRITAPGRIRWALAWLRGHRDMRSYALARVSRKAEHQARYQQRQAGIRHAIRWAAHNTRVFAADVRNWLAKPFGSPLPRWVLIFWLAVLVVTITPATSDWCTRHEHAINEVFIAALIAVVLLLIPLRMLRLYLDRKARGR